MKFSQVFMLVSVLFAISFALPSNWEENDEVVLASNDNAVQEKRVIPVFLLIAAKKKLIGAAIKVACSIGNLSGKVKGVCDCVSLVVGDEESAVDERRWLFSSALSKLKKVVNSSCNNDNKIVKFALSGLCGCIQPFL